MGDVVGGARALARIAVLALLWGSTFLWIKLALAMLTPVQVTLARCVLGAGALTAACLWTGHRLPRGFPFWRRVFIAAFFCNALPFTMFSIGEQRFDSGVAGVLNATTPLWSLLIGIALGTERAVRAVRLVGLLLGFGGVLLIFAPWERAGGIDVGALAIVGAAISYAIGFTYMGRALVGKGFSTVVLSASQLIAATALTALTLPAGGLASIPWHPKGLIATAALGIFATGITFHLTYRIIAAEGATNAATVGYLLPVVSVGLGAVVLGEAFNLRIAAGMAIVLAGVALTRRKRKPSASPSDPGGDIHCAGQLTFPRHSVQHMRGIPRTRKNRTH
ncbi:DMT family transporter [Streptomyces tropicalis]|uniref:DMT family transporter n=1 Tax=Streptomyces tropicalis TaxID=3034234 RepID=A0ABT6A467_9ACTN|nr:DMT family transporter [Streptomyces tropicalis]MDF3299439.1 DMT family transporter [Streptomyces tropicalis]